MASISEQLEELTNRHRHDLGGLFDYLDNMALALGGNMSFSTPDDYTLTGDEGDYDCTTGSTTTVDITVELVDSEGNRCPWFDGSLAVTSSVQTGSGGISNDGPISMEDGVGTVTLTLDGSGTPWAAGDEAKLQVDSQSILGYSLSTDSVVITIPTAA